jgi:hypothetical protein
VSRRTLILTCVALLAGFALSPAVDARSRRPRPPSPKKIERLLREADEKIYYLSRSGLKDLEITFPKVTKLGDITRKMFWRAPGRVLYRVEDLPEAHQKIQRAYVGQLLHEFDGVMYALVSKPWTEVAKEYDVTVPDPSNLKVFVFTPKKDDRRRWIRKILELGPKGMPARVTTIWPAPPPTKEELEIDPEFKGRPIETYVEMTYQKIDRWYFFRRLDIETKGRKAIVDMEKWEKRGRYYLPVELTLVDPFAGNEVLTPDQIRLDQGLEEEMFEGFPHRLER